MQTMGSPSWLKPWKSIGAIRPVSNTIRRQAGACASAVAISAGVDGTFASCMTTPSRFMTHTCVSAIETSSPAKYSMCALLFQNGADPIGLRCGAAAHYPMLKNYVLRRLGAADSLWSLGDWSAADDGGNAGAGRTLCFTSFRSNAMC